MTNVDELLLFSEKNGEMKKMVLFSNTKKCVYRGLIHLWPFLEVFIITRIFTSSKSHLGNYLSEG